MRFFKQWVLICVTLLCSVMAVQAAADKPTIKIGYVEGWADSVITTQTAANIIQHRLGYRVQLVPVAAGLMWQGV